MNEILLSALNSIPVADISRDSWLKIGMALKEEGFDCSVWDEWSQNDTRYRDGECEYLWSGFHGSDTPVTGGTIIMLAKQYGWCREDRVSGDVTGTEVDVPGKDLQEGVTTSWDPVDQFKIYLSTLFKPDEYVAYVTFDVWCGEDGKISPGAGVFNRTAGDLLASLERYPNDLSYTVGDWKEEAGAWIQINPVDGKGVRKENVTRFSYALLECDSISKEEQIRAFKESRLPIDIMVDSGGKSIHALVNVDAANEQEYAYRVKYLYEYCDAHGIPVDKQNKNPNRKSRMPGVTRNGNRQYIVSMHTGMKSWGEWVEYVKSRTNEKTDGFPDIELLSNYIFPPALPDELIKGILRKGHKMLMSGSSKGGKSFLLIELAIAIAEGQSWLGFECSQGKVLYINFEIDKDSFINRLFEIYQAMEIPMGNKGNIAMWNLRGHAIPLDQLTPSLIKRVRNNGFSAIIVDPIYKVITGDENSATAMAEFTNNFDRICTETGCAVIYCHHHSKGAQGGKKAMDRASGSGVFARDPDAQLDMIELELTDDVKSLLPDDKVTAWRLESSLREFANITPVDFWFVHPIHRLDDTGILASMEPAGSSRASKLPDGKAKVSPDPDEEFRAAFYACKADGEVTVKDMMEYLGCSDKTIYSRRSKLSDEFDLQDGIITSRY